MTKNQTPQFAVINLITGEIIDLADFARDHIDPARQREILRRAMQQVSAGPGKRGGDALAGALFAPGEEPE